MNLIRTLAAVDINSVMNNGMSFGERLADGGKMILIVMAFVFSVIFIIWLSQSLITLAVTKLSSVGKKKENKDADETAVTEEVPSETCDDAVTVAVITAALSAYLASNSDNGEIKPFRVVSFKRTKSGKPWNV